VYASCHVINISVENVVGRGVTAAGKSLGIADRLKGKHPVSACTGQYLSLVGHAAVFQILDLKIDVTERGSIISDQFKTSDE